MRNISDILNDRLPKLDIHGETVLTSDLLIKEFINDNCKLGNNEVIIIHGKGQGLLKDKTHEVLKADKRVIEFYLVNIGSTKVKLNIDK